MSPCSARESALHGFRVTMLFFIALCTVNKIIDLLLRRQFLLFAAFLVFFSFVQQRLCLPALTHSHRRDYDAFNYKHIKGNICSWFSSESRGAFASHPFDIATDSLVHSPVLLLTSISFHFSALLSQTR